MIGVFDSGLGGLVILKELDKHFPEHTFVYLGDNARSPYGTRPPEEVFQFTLQAVEYLFGQGCELVILACNTASANALRRIQQEVLPVKYPGKRVLGILVPTVEQVTGVNWAQETSDSDKAHTIAVFATPGTVNSQAYELEMKKRNPGARVFQVACPTLVPMIEGGEEKVPLAREIGKYVEELKRLMRDSFPPDAVLLGCTHYPLVHDIFVQAFPSDVHVYDQGVITAESLEKYLTRHPEIDNVLVKNGERTFLTTGDAEIVSELAEVFYGKPTEFTKIAL